MPGGWAGSTRRYQMPSNWQTLKAAVKQRDGYRCTATMADGTRCPGGADEVDHVRRGHDHGMGNLRSLCSWHHGKKSSAEGNASRRRISTKRQAEDHPGLIDR